ncbi:hypothetical protein [[Clostridium] polysaccharolyticum]|uniref:Uncharacterized protein n=1 Tax=[Clostridium] polysaccharolyticum TaxID=29364 RepID=A0A1I0CB07_9FIRM|nr:hypothetical protein [[Clostridium] polysaccharolyticum]SET16691.1 hypothetical protein SAMN04487772_109105 [[Clostridium] polysaccharolyticum]
MNRLEKTAAKLARDYADKNVNDRPSKVTEQLKTRLKETRKKT